MLEGGWRLTPAPRESGTFVSHSDTSLERGRLPDDLVERLAQDDWSECEGNSDRGAVVKMFRGLCSSEANVREEAIRSLEELALPQSSLTTPCAVVVSRWLAEFALAAVGSDEVYDLAGCIAAACEGAGRDSVAYGEIGLRCLTQLAPMADTCLRDLAGDRLSPQGRLDAALVLLALVEHSVAAPSAGGLERAIEIEGVAEVREVLAMTDALLASST